MRSGQNVASAWSVVQSAAELETHVVVRSTLASRENRVVDALLDVRLLVLAEEDETSAGTAKGLVAARRQNEQRHGVSFCRLYASKRAR